MSIVPYNIHITVCPICHERIETLEFVNHTLEQHPYFFVVWASINMPGFHTPAILEMPDEIEEMSYEFLSELCDRIGYHRTGLDNINDKTTSITFTDKQDCPICFESMEVATKINVCSHYFCDDCIRRWLSEHKTCPICIRDLT